MRDTRRNPSIQPVVCARAGVNAPDPAEFAARWIAAWNARDIEAVLADYAEDVVFSSPTAARFVPDSGGVVRGKDTLRRYWTLALEANPGLHFELLEVFAGVDTLVLQHRNQLVGTVSEVLTFREGLVSVGHATHIGRGGALGERNKRLVRRALEEIYANGNVSVAGELFHRDYEDHEPAHPELPTGPASVVQTVRSLHGVFGDLRFQVEDEMADGDKVVQVVRMSGRQIGRLMGHESAGKVFAVRHIYIWRIVDGQIIEHWGSRDDLGLLRQLGLLGGGAEPDTG
jgi:ketosteroid isomerase-like protein